MMPVRLQVPPSYFVNTIPDSGRACKRGCRQAISAGDLLIAYALSAYPQRINFCIEYGIGEQKFFRLESMMG